MTVLEWIEARCAELRQAQAIATVNRQFNICLQIEGALLDYAEMHKAFTPKLELTVEEPDTELEE